MTSPTETVTVPPQVMFRLVGDEAVLLDLQSGMYFGLDPVGARMWNLLAEGRTLDDVASTVAEEYGVEVGRVQSDILELVATLRGKGLLA
jgi:hypothetical protein